MPWSFVSKITNFKHQITNKSQIPIFNDQNFPGQDIVWIFGFRIFDRKTEVFGQALTNN